MSVKETVFEWTRHKIYYAHNALKIDYSERSSSLVISMGIMDDGCFANFLSRCSFLGEGAGLDAHQSSY